MGDAAENVDGLSSESEVPAVLDGTAEAQRDLDPRLCTSGIELGFFSRWNSAAAWFTATRNSGVRMMARPHRGGPAARLAHCGILLEFVGSTGRPPAGATLGRHRHPLRLLRNPQEEYRVMFAFIKEGLARGDRSLQIVEPALRADCRQQPRAAGVDVILGGSR
ncbi:hypothetical protein [Ramlibacter sp.]|uniref:hypothetical protein n=1 Tax=Ramlibacter sp. TaxID=1917967 RepID=UPI0026212E47|nr:hypothetical protein [Ramlibacter sp.]MDB5956386.1 MEthanogen/methylotroph, DcmR Sensory domain [Ramlibacter sp.]